MKGSFSLSAFKILVTFSVLHFYSLVSDRFVDLGYVCFLCLWIFVTILGNLELLFLSIKTLKRIRSIYSEKI